MLRRDVATIFTINRRAQPNCDRRPSRAAPIGDDWGDVGRAKSSMTSLSCADYLAGIAWAALAGIDRDRIIPVIVMT